MVDVLLASGDALKAQLARHQGNGADELETTALLNAIRAMANGGAPAASPALTTPAPVVVVGASSVSATASASLAPGTRVLELTVGPLNDLLQANALVDLFKEITDLGAIEPLDAGWAADNMRRFKVATTSSDNDLLDLFTFHVDRSQVKLARLGAGYGFHEDAPGAPEVIAEAPEAGYGFFEDAPRDPGAAGMAAASTAPSDVTAPAAVAARHDIVVPAKAAVRPEKAASAAESGTLRVSVDKVDKLINLVGELVITQAMLTQNGKAVDAAVHAHMSAGLAGLERNTRDLQEAVMSIRMTPLA
jgi:two-component system, chemotaxis family, sensor kinase CheA